MNTKKTYTTPHLHAISLAGSTLLLGSGKPVTGMGEDFSDQLNGFEGDDGQLVRGRTDRFKGESFDWD